MAVFCLVTSAQSALAAEVSSPVKSVFENPIRKPNYCDPFFPKSPRYGKIIAVVTPGEKAPVVQDFYKDLIVKGISLGKRRFATINNQTMAVGESTKIKVNPQGSPLGVPLNIQVIEIKDRSVVIKVEGAPESKEIPLKF